MKKLFIAIAAALSAMSILAAPIVPTDDGMTWRYRMTVEMGENFRMEGLPGEQNKLEMPVIYRRSGSRDLDGQTLLVFEMHRTGQITNTDLMKVDEHGIICYARIDANGELTKLKPPQIVVPPLLKGAKWDYETEIAGAKVHQHCEISGEEDVDLPAGKFHAFKIHSDQTQPAKSTEDRWFVGGVGIVKDVTERRTDDGDLINRITLELTERPKIAPRPAVNTPKQLSAVVGKDAVGDTASEFDQSTDKIYARWKGNGLRKGAKIRCVWIAENIGEVAPPDYAIDEAAATASAPDARGIFTLSRPPDGWAPGLYRVEFYVDDGLIDTVRLKIDK
jgi:hypothetical protein